MPNKKYYPPVRVNPAAYEHLRMIIAAYTDSGRYISMTKYVSDLILAQPIPSDNNHGNGTPPGNGDYPAQKKANLHAINDFRNMWHFEL